LAKKENLDALIAPFDRPEADKMRAQLGAAAPGAASSSDLESKDGIIAAYRAGKITLEDASKRLIDKGYAIAPPPPPPPPPAKPEAPLAQ
jgi:hypothetical protein